ncbi:uncharacterized protein [Dermacentor andersoni]|uniref:uncharacterized protein n=1 Tax=Dermacentor andersoni TaxID=34620 RepID=UPI00241781DE|nr:uncharacterized protein LOC126540560 [Dermacentor andersoni]XP_054932095.1 uncharacterized protein LOC126540560 [Dermacentor andersoni]
MVEIFRAILVTMAASVLALPSARSEAKHQLVHGVTDAFKTLRAFPYVMSIYDADADGDLNCVYAVRTDFSDEPLQATYVLLVNGIGGRQPRNITYHIKPGPSPDVTLFTIDDDYDNVHECHFDYTDYKNCVILEFLFVGGQDCLLWITKEALADIPEECMRQYVDTCDQVPKSYDEETCDAFSL